ncbi:MAG TPA: alpha/beta family hydrolase [Candidatus Binataceae bacterium]|nr:alpha/beta family hydrolase [Candidatus Binataceae bacterium]
MDFLFDGPKTAERMLVLAHGAGAPMDSPFMQAIAEGVAASGIRVARFEFPYMHRRREGGRGGAPDPPRILTQSWLDAIEELGGSDRMVIGGKSLGGRVASMVADEARVRGLVCLGYPFHPPGNPEKTRTKHLEELKTRALILQGERDPFGLPGEVARYKLSRKIRIEWIPDGDHSFKPRKSSGHTEAENLRRSIALVTTFVKA